MKKTLFIFLFSINLINNAQAISISEIMYDPEGSDSGREWVEIFNDSVNDIDFTNYKLNESGTNHGILIFSTDKIIKAGASGIIADNPSKFLIDFPNYLGVLYDSAFSLNNTGELITLKDGTLSQIDSVDYSSSLGGNDDGSTLSLINGYWARGKATPGEVNIGEIKSTSTPETSSSFTITPVMSAPLPDIHLLLPERVEAIAGADKSFSIKAVNSLRSEIEGLNYTWSFGDGGIKTGKSVSYHYSYPGAYNIIVEAEGSGYFEKGRSLAIVTAPAISILKSDIGVAGLYFDIKNEASNEIDLSDWILEVNSNFYTIPKNTILSGNQITKVSGNALGISTSTIYFWNKDSTNTRLLYPDHSVMLKFNSTNTLAINEKPEIEVSKEVKPQIQQKEEVVLKKVFPVKNTPITTRPLVYESKATSTKVATIETSRKDTRIVSFIKGLFSSWFK